MTRQIEQAYLDEEWLYGKLATRRFNPTMDQVDTFCDRVWELVSKGIGVPDARSTALTEVFGRR